MMHVFQASNITQLYRELLNTVSTQGELEGKTRDLPGVYIELTDPNQSMLAIKKNWEWCFQETFDRFSGALGFPPTFQNPGHSWKYRVNWAKKLKKEGGLFHYAYGESFLYQLPAVIKQLKKQRTSREAIISIWSDKYLLEQGAFNRRPCTLTLHFMIRNKKLLLFVNMRSNDLINLFPYDVFHHTFIQKYIASKLNLGLGSYHHFTSHMYYPKKREREGREFISRTLAKLDDVLKENRNHNITGLDTDQIDKDLKIACSHLYYPEPNLKPVKSPLLKNMVEFIQGHNVNLSGDFRLFIEML